MACKTNSVVVKMKMIITDLTISTTLPGILVGSLKDVELNLDWIFKIQDSRFFIFALFISLTTAKNKNRKEKIKRT